MIFATYYLLYIGYENFKFSNKMKLRTDENDFSYSSVPIF